ncbi:MAG: bifunctional aspartate kinase/homoserine dehydrogenase I, partial [Myxococcales bacterium]|nr:bifunctional aspartate kinase/homoserine dehydrogenase I [Myxococcales bacterium]
MSDSDPHPIILKFGGSSLGGRERLQAVAEIIAGYEETPVVVVSAMGDTTDQIFGAADAAEQGNLDRVGELTTEIARAHRAAVDDDDCHELIGQLVAELTLVLEGVYLLREQTPRSRAFVASFGERLCAPLLV